LNKEPLELSNRTDHLHLRALAKSISVELRASVLRAAHAGINELTGNGPRAALGVFQELAV
jgi:hypothetical protein